MISEPQNVSDTVQTYYQVDRRFPIYHQIRQKRHPSRMNAKKSSSVATHGAVEPNSVTGLFCMQKLHSQIIIVVYDCLLNVNNDNVPVSIPNLNELKKKRTKFLSIQKRVLKK